jgi:transposase, IS605 orfB family
MDEYAFECKNLYNSTLYQYRQNFFNGEKLLSAFDMINYLKSHETKVPVKVKQQTIKQVYESVKSSIKKTKLPRYLNKETGRANIILTNQAILKIKFTNENKIAFNYHDFCFEFNIANLIKKIELKFEHIQQVRVIYHLKRYQIILVVKKEPTAQPMVASDSIAAIDLGLNNIISIVFQNQRILFDGKPLKKINHRFNKNLAKLQSKKALLQNRLDKVNKELDNKMIVSLFYYELNSDVLFNEEKYKKLINKRNRLENEINNLKTKIARLYEKRNNRIKYCLHKLSRDLIELMAANGISKIVIGYNKEWKQDINLGKRNNQNFVQIPFKTLVDYITYKANDYNIEVITQEESYTSKCSFLDDEEVCKHEIYAGKRVKRGLFRSKNGYEIHADINAAYNIAKKAGFNFAQAQKLESFSPCSWAVVRKLKFN